MATTHGENRLTDTALSRMKLPVGGKISVFDGGGLRGELMVAGNRRVCRFAFRFQVENVRAEMRLGTWPTMSLADLRAKRNKAREMVRQGIDPRAAAREVKAEAEAAKANAAARLSVGMVFEKWDALHLKRAYKDGGAEVRRIFVRDVLPVLGGVAIEELTRRQIAAVVDTALARGAPRIAQMILVYLRQMCRWSVTRGYLESDPSAALSKASIKVNAARERVLSDAEIMGMVKLMPLAGLPKWAPPAIWLLLATAARAGELFNSRWTDVDLGKREWLIPAANSKNGRAHLVDLSDFALARLGELAELRTGPWLFAGRAPGTDFQGEPKPLGDKVLTRMLKDRQRDEGFVPLRNRTAEHSRGLILPGGPWTPHDLRRTAATIMQAVGVTPPVIEKCLNHTEPGRLIAVYHRHDYRVERRDAFARLGHHLAQLAQGEPGSVVSLRRSA